MKLYLPKGSEMTEPEEQEWIAKVERLTSSFHGNRDSTIYAYETASYLRMRQNSNYKEFITDMWQEHYDRAEELFLSNKKKLLQNDLLRYSFASIRYDIAESGYRMTETTQLPLRIGPKDLVYQDRNQKVHKIVAQFDGFSKEYFVSDRGERSALMAVRNGEVLFVRQYRLIINALSYEIPGGRIDEDETPESAAIRECFEETGVKCSNLKPLISYYPSLDIEKCYTYVFLSENCNELSEGDSDRRIWIPLSRCIDMVSEGEIVDGLTILALLAYNTKINSRSL